MIAATVVFNAGCGSFNVKGSYAGDTGLYFDTAVSIGIYDERAEELLEGCFKLCGEMEDMLSAQDTGSELYRIDHQDTQIILISKALSECIVTGLEAGRVSEGEFDITIFPVTGLWDFRSGTGTVPDAADIKEALSHVDQSKVLISGNELSLADSGTQIDLGAVAKGYISGVLKDYLKKEGCDGAVINLGGNVSTLGTKGEEPYKIGIQKPFSDRGETVVTVWTGEGCVISSGIYERYFEEDGRLYHHILSAKTGYPLDTDLTQVTVIGKEDALCDALSTVFMMTGREKAEHIIMDEGYDIRVIFVGRDGDIRYFVPGEGEKEVKEGDVIKLI